MHFDNMEKVKESGLEKTREWISEIAFPWWVFALAIALAIVGTWIGSSEELKNNRKVKKKKGVDKRRASPIPMTPNSQKKK